MKRPILRDWRSLLPFLIGILLIWWVLRNVSLREVGATLGHLSWTDLGLLVVANAIVLGLLTLRWAIFLWSQGCRVSFLHLVNYRLAAFGVSYFTPGPHFGGEPLQVYLPVKRNGVDFDKAVTAVALDKALELIVNFAFLVAAALFVLQRGLLTGASGLSVVGYAIVLLAIPALLLGSIWAGRHPLSAPVAWWQRRRNSARLQTAARRIRQSEDAVGNLCRRQPGAIALALVVALLAWLAMIGEFWLATVVLDIGLTPGQALVALLAMRLAILLPMPAGLGALEASLVMAMELLGVSGAAGLSLALLIRARDVLLGLLGLALGGYSLWRRPLPAEVLPEPQGNFHEAS